MRELSFLELLVKWFSIVGGKKGREEFQARFEGSGLGFLAFKPRPFDLNYEETYLEYWIPYLQLMMYCHQTDVLQSYVQNRGQNWKGKNEGVKFSGVIGEMKALARKCGAGWWLWDGVEQQVKRFGFGDRSVFKSNNQIGNFYLAQ